MRNLSNVSSLTASNSSISATQKPQSSLNNPYFAIENSEKDKMYIENRKKFIDLASSLPERDVALNDEQKKSLIAGVRNILIPLAKKVEGIIDACQAEYKAEKALDFLGVFKNLEFYGYNHYSPADGHITFGFIIELLDLFPAGKEQLRFLKTLVDKDMVGDLFVIFGRDNWLMKVYPYINRETTSRFKLKPTEVVTLRLHDAVAVFSTTDEVVIPFLTAGNKQKKIQEISDKVKKPAEILLKLFYLSRNEDLINRYELILSQIGKIDSIDIRLEIEDTIFNNGSKFFNNGESSETEMQAIGNSTN